MKILHVITDLDRGGAEIMLARILPLLRTAGCQQQVICLSGPGNIGKIIQENGFPVSYLNMKRSVPDLFAWIRLVKMIRLEQPDLIHSWLYHADLYVSLADLFVQKPLVWGLHNSTLGTKSNRITRVIVRILSKLSHLVPRRILSCSKEAMKVHQALGYRPDIMRFVPNGFDTVTFKPDLHKRMVLRNELRLSDQQILVGNISRFDPQKNHTGLIECWGMLAVSRPDVRFLLAGKGLDAGNPVIRDLLRSAGIDDKTILLGIREDVPALLNALDLFVFSSNSGEAFPLIIGEAMSSGILCVGTKVGDTADLIGPCGRVVEPDDIPALLQACLEMLALSEEEKKELREDSRRRIKEQFSLEKMSQGYLAVYREILAS